MENSDTTEYLTEYANVNIDANCCRVCLRSFIENDTALEIDEILIDQFRDLMNFEVRICNLVIRI